VEKLAERVLEFEREALMLNWLKDLLKKHFIAEEEELDR